MDRRSYSITYHIKDALVLLFYKLFSFAPLSKRIRIEHFKRNTVAWNNYRARFSNDKYIEHQPALTDFAYGKRHNADYNSCEVIAVYNALVSMGIGCNFPELIKNFEKRGITCFGAFGTSPFSLMRYLKAEGFNIKYYNYQKWLRICTDNSGLYFEFEEGFDSFILMSYNNARSIRDMIHTMCITKEDDHYKLHNDYEGAKCYKTLKAAVDGYMGGRSRMILIIGIRKK